MARNVLIIVLAVNLLTSMHTGLLTQASEQAESKQIVNLLKVLIDNAVQANLADLLNEPKVQSDYFVSFYFF